MKIRQGFVSNSSSSSFIILKKDLSEKEILDLQNWDKKVTEFLNFIGESREYRDEGGWVIVENEDNFEGITSMDNLGIGEFFLWLHINKARIEEGHW